MEEELLSKITIEAEHGFQGVQMFELRDYVKHLLEELHMEQLNQMCPHCLHADMMFSTDCMGCAPTLEKIRR